MKENRERQQRANTAEKMGGEERKKRETRKTTPQTRRTTKII